MVTLWWIDLGLWLVAIAAFAFAAWEPNDNPVSFNPLAGFAVVVALICGAIGVVLMLGLLIAGSIQ